MKLHINAIFVSMVRSREELNQLKLLIQSIRTWGGELAQNPFTIFNVNPVQVSCRELKNDITESIMLDVPENIRNYFYGDKVFAGARAEELYPEEGTIIWIDPACLVVNPPLEYRLQSKYDCAVRPVHIKNVGLLVDEPLDVFWKKIYEVVGFEDTARSVETFIGKQQIRAYYNTHAFSVNPSVGILRKWLEYFELLANDVSYQKAACEDVWHKVFLHQAVLSGIITSDCEEQKVKLLPPEYNYPYNLQDKVPEERRASAFNNLISIAYEKRSLDPDKMSDIEVRGPLKHWLKTHIK